MLHPASDRHVDGCGWAKEEIMISADVSTPESLLALDGQSIVLTAPVAGADDYNWQYYTFNEVSNIWQWDSLEATGDTISLEVSTSTIQTGYRLVYAYWTEEGSYFIDTKPFYLGGYDFYNWIHTNEDIQAWMADASVTLADVVARYNEKDCINADDYTYEGENGQSVNLKVPEGAFDEPYIMEIETTVPSEETVDAMLQSMDATGTHEMQVLTAFDISFAALADRARKLQPAEGTSVALTFEVDTTGIDEALKYLYVYHIANDGTPEVVAGPIDAAFGKQTIVVRAEAFSVYAVVLSSDSCAYCQNNAECVYEKLIAMGPDEQYEYLLETNELELVLKDYERHVAAGDPAVLCTCDKLTTAPGTEHAANCPWHKYYEVRTDALGASIMIGFNESTSGATYKWYELMANEDGSGTEEVILEGETQSILECVVSLEPRTYVLKETLSGQDTVYTYEVVAQTTALGSYVNYMLTVYWDYFDTGMSFEEYTEWAYDYVTNVLDVDIQHTEDSEAFNLGEAVVSFWNQSEYGKAMYPDLLCACGVIGAIDTPDVLMLPYEGEHDMECFWYHGAPAVKLMEEADGSYSLYIDPVDENGFWIGYADVIATSQMLDGKYHYFQDVTTGWYVAYLHEEINEDGTVTQWIIPLPSEKDIEETPAT